MRGSLRTLYTNHREQLGRSWILLNLVYGAFRVLLVKATVADYGVNTAVFAGIELASSLGTGFGTVRLVDAIVSRQRRGIQTWGALAAVAFFSPDVYVLLAGDSQMPRTVYVVVGLWIAAAATLSVSSMVREVRKRRLGVATK